MLFYYPEEKIKGVQIFGSDPEIMGWAASSKELSFADLIDINMGCPVPKVYRNGDGSALLNDINLASKIIEKVSSSGKDVSVKFRIGINNEKIITADFAKMCEDSGASMITIHGRTREAFYSGECNYEEILRAKNRVKIPVIANGGVFTEEDANLLMDRTGADGVMIARGALLDPRIFSKILHKETKDSIKDIMLRQISLMKDRYGDYTAIMLRKAFSFYVKGLKGSKDFKLKLIQIEKVDELIELVNDFGGLNEI